MYILEGEEFYIIAILYLKDTVMLFKQKWFFKKVQEMDGGDGYTTM